MPDRPAPTINTSSTSASDCEGVAGTVSVKARAPRSGWQAFEYGEARRYHRPVRTPAREDGDRRMEVRGIVERARIDCKAVVLTDPSAEHQAATHRTEIAHRVAAACGFRRERPARAAEAHGAAAKPHEGNEAGAGGLAAVGTVAVAHGQGLAFG